MNIWFVLRYFLLSLRVLITAEITTAGDLVGLPKEKVIAELRDQGMAINSAKETFIGRIIENANPPKRAKKSTFLHETHAVHPKIVLPRCGQRGFSRRFRSDLFQPSESVFREKHSCGSSSYRRETEDGADNRNGRRAENTHPCWGDSQALAL